MPAVFEGHKVKFLRLEYPEPVKWAGHMEAHMDVVLLTLYAGGAKGVAETSVRLKWHSASVRSFIATMEDVFIPLLAGVDLADAEVTSAALSRVREHPLIRSLIDMACWDLRASLSETPLWRFLGAGDAAVPVSFTITRAKPQFMAERAAMAVEKFGVRAFKIKTGQTLELDTIAVRYIREAVGDDVELFADSNSSYRREDVSAISGMLADYGVRYFEDPCPFAPTHAFRELMSECKLPILVDDGCRSLRDSDLFVEAGAQALSVKTMKTGISESLAIAKRAAAADCKVSVGISAVSSLGAILALSLATALPGSVKRIPCEETFFLVSGGYLTEELIIRNGCVELPNATTLSEVLDWDRVRALEPT